MSLTMSEQTYSNTIMPEIASEIKPSLGRFFWILFTSFGVIFIPLSVAAACWLIWGLEISTQNAIVGLTVIGGVALGAMACVALIVARGIIHRMEAVRGAVGRIAAGQFDHRIPLEHREQIEELAHSLDQTQKYLKSRVADLESSRNQLRTVLDSMVEGVIAIDHDQKVLLVNQAGSRLFSFQDLAVAGRPIWELVRSPQLGSWISQSLSRSEPVGGELELKAPLPRILSVRVARLPGPSISGAIIVASDISQLRRLEQVRQEFVANASHELKTPLASIKGCVETLLDGAIDDPEARLMFLQTVNEHTERLDKLVRDLLSLTRIESAENRPQLHPVELDSIVKLCINRHVRNAERKGMKLSSTPPASPLLVVADEESLEQILDNLIDNAIKYTNPGGEISLRWEIYDGRCRIEVEDTGIGIPQAHLGRIFERFYRVDRARSRELGGTGLGLSIVKHLVQQLGGTVQVASRLGKGTTFTIELNLAAAISSQSITKE